MSTQSARPRDPHRSPPPHRPPPTHRFPVVPVVALAVTVLVQAAQLLVMRARGAHHGMSLTEVMMQWDSRWMTLISRHGYSGFTMGNAGTPDGDPVEWQSVAFFPGYPVLVRAVAAPVRALTGADITVGAAVAVSSVMCAVMVWGLGRLAADHLWPAAVRKGRGGTPSGASPVSPSPASPATAAVLTMAVGVLALGAPMSVVYVMPYSESLYTACAVWAVVMLLRRRYLTAGVLVLVAGLTRLTAAALVLTLVAAAVVELVRWWHGRRGRRDAAAPQDAGNAGDAGAAVSVGTVLRACAAPVIGVLGIAAYISWADVKAAGVGGYFAAQDRGWHSGFDYGVATWDWITSTSLDLTTTVGAGGAVDGTMPGYAVSTWSMILVALLCVASLWPLATGRIPWQLWLPAVVVAGMTLGSDGIMHSRPRLLLIPVLFLLTPPVVWALARLRVRLVDRPWVAAVPVVVGVAWCAAGFWVSGEMLIGFAYAI